MRGETLGLQRSVPQQRLRKLSVQRHRELEAACDQLVAASLQEEPHAFSARWNVIEQALREHIAIEEELLLPAYQAARPGDAQTLRAEHARILRLLSEIAMHVQHYGIHVGRLRQLISELHAHATHEDLTLYRWADKQGIAVGIPR
jgi:hypothetical protein